MLSMSPSKRRDTDMMKLMMSDFEVHIPDESTMHDFLVAFPGPEDTPYEGGVWKVHVTLPKEYPFKSPSIGFENRMFHPNVDEMSGSVCLDVINQTWSPMFDLVNIFKLFIPQLLSYPNPTDPLNGEAAALLMRDPEAYARRIRECVRLHASDPVHLDGTPVITTDSASSSISSNDSADDSAMDEEDKTPDQLSSSTAAASGNSSGGSGSNGETSDVNKKAEGGAGAGEGEQDSASKVGREDKLRRQSSEDTNDGAGSSSGSDSADYMMQLDMDETASDVSMLSDVDG